MGKPRARLAETPEPSDHTSIKRRINQALKAKQQGLPEQQADGLPAFSGNPREHMPDGILFRLSDCIESVDWSGRIIREVKKGLIPERLPDILQRLSIDPSNRVYLTKKFEHPFKNLVGAAHHVRRACETISKNRVHGISQCERLFPSA